MKMKKIRVHRFIINRHHLMFNICDQLCFLSKNMYNLCNYTIRQEFFKTGRVKQYGELNKELKYADEFKEMGSNAAQMVTKAVCKSWKSFLISVKEYSQYPDKYFEKPRIPKYKRKNGRFICTLTNKQTQIVDGYLYFSFKRLKQFNMIFKTEIDGRLISTRIIPKGGCYILELVYERDIDEQLSLNSNHIAAIDLGINNFVTMVNNIGLQPIVINGKGIKSYNRYYNKQISKFRSIAKIVNGIDWTNRMQDMTDKRYRKMEYFMHCASKKIINYCIKNNIGTLIIGKNDQWKQKIKLGKKNNQNFINVPYESFIEKLEYKCEDYGIQFIKTEESYTSSTSFLDDELPIKENYNKSRRKFRGLFISKSGKSINADVNGAFQIMRKVFSNVKANEIVGAYSHPVIINI